MLALLQTGRLPDEIESNEGAAVYVFSDLHLNRALGFMWSAWNYDTPYYRLNEEGSLERKGSFRTGRVLITRLYLFLGRSSFLKLINFDFPLKHSDRDIRLIAEIIKESRNQYLKQFHGKFYLLIHPFEAKG